MYWGKDHLKEMWKQVELDGVRYSFIKNKTNGFVFASVNRVLDLEVEEIEIPEVVNDCPVIEIGSFSFSCCRELKKVDLPQCIMHISTKAFYGCKKLSVINVPEMLKEIHREAFEDCYSLEKMDISFNVKIEEGAFINCPLEKQYKGKCTSWRDMYK